MGEVASWQHGSMKKAGSQTLSVGSLHPKLGGVARFADGGEVDSEAADKAAGLKASAGEDVGLLERLRAGNIDQPGSEAYNRFGAGRARGDANEMLRESRRTAASATPTEITVRPSIPATDSAKHPDTEFGDLEGAQKRAAEADQAKPSVSAVKPVAAASPSKTAARPIEKARPATPKITEDAGVSAAYAGGYKASRYQPKPQGKVNTAAPAQPGSASRIVDVKPFDKNAVDPNTLLPKR